MGYNEAAQQSQTDTLVSPCKLRVNRSAPLTLTASWQRVDFSGTSAFNTNTYPVRDGKQTLRWDAASKLFRFSGQAGNQYKFDLYVQVTSQTAMLAAGGLTVVNLGQLGVATVQARFVIPKPDALGGPFYFPFPESTKSIGVCRAGFVQVDDGLISPTVTSNADMLANGLGLDLKLSNGVVGAVNVTDCNLLIHGR